MLIHVSQTQRRRLANQLPQHASTTGKVADRPFGLIVDPEIDEALELGVVVVEDPERRILGRGQLAGGLDNRAQDGLEIELGEQCGSDVDQAAEAILGGLAPGGALR